MLNGKMTALAIGASAAVSLASAPAHAQFKIGVAANFATAVQNLVDTFSTLQSPALDPNAFTITVDSTGNLKNCILTATSCANGQFDLFLAADNTTPSSVASKGMVYSGVTQTPFFYAMGSLELYAPLAAGSSYAFVNSGLPTSLSGLPLVIANPSSAPYGFAGMTVINTYIASGAYTTQLGTQPITTGSSFPVASLVYTAPNIGVTFDNISSGDSVYKYGFIHKSAICTKSGSTEVFDDGNGAGSLYHFEYVWNTGSHQYGEIIQDGIALELSQTNTVKAQVINFIAYLQGTGGTGVNNGLTIIKSYCYGTSP
jgi:hypothetical protein